MLYLALLITITPAVCFGSIESEAGHQFWQSVLTGLFCTLFRIKGILSWLILKRSALFNFFTRSRRSKPISTNTTQTSNRHLGEQIKSHYSLNHE